MDETQIIVNSISALNAFILSGILCFRRKNVLPNYMLAGIMIIPGLYFTNSIFLLEQKAVPWLFYTVQFCAVFFGPFYSIYVYSILGKKLTRLRPVFFISALIGIIPCYLIYNYFNIYDEERKVHLFIQLIKGPYPPIVTFYSLIFYSFQQIVFVFLLFEINKFKKRVVQFYSDIDQFKVIYLRNLTVLLIILNFSILILYIVFDILIVEYILIPLIITLIYIYIVYYAFKNYGIFTREEYQVHLKHISTFIEENKNTFSPNNTSNFREEIERILTEQNLTSDPKVTLKKLAQAMNLPQPEVSKLIRVEMESNFYDLINSRRIEHAKKLLREENDYTFEGIGYEVGFNSRAAFYRAFKKYTGTTPTNYLSETYSK